MSPLQVFNIDVLVCMLNQHYLQSQLLNRDIFKLIVHFMRISLVKARLYNYRICLLRPVWTGVPGTPASLLPSTSPPSHIQHTKDANHRLFYLGRNIGQHQFKSSRGKAWGNKCKMNPIFSFSSQGKCHLRCVVFFCRLKNPYIYVYIIYTFKF